MSGMYTCKARAHAYTYNATWEQTGLEIVWSAKFFDAYRSGVARGDLRLPSLLADPEGSIRTAVERHMEEHSCENL